MKLPDLPPVSGLRGKGNTSNTDCTRRSPGGNDFGQEFDSPHLHQNAKIPLDLNGSGGIFVVI